MGQEQGCEPRVESLDQTPTLKQGPCITFEATCDTCFCGQTLADFPETWLRRAGESGRPFERVPNLTQDDLVG